MVIGVDAARGEIKQCRSGDLTSAPLSPTRGNVATVLGNLLAQFLFRLAWGLALAMTVTSSDQVTSGFFRVHLWVLLGLDTLAALSLLAIHGSTPQSICFGACILGAVISYIGSVCWLYEQPRAGKWCLALVAVANVVAAISWTVGDQAQTFSVSQFALVTTDILSGGALLGVAIASMLLGHWYLNTPTMQLAPLRRLICGIGWAVVLRAAFAATSLGLALASGVTPSQGTLLLILLRWLAGLIAAGFVVWMAWQTLKIPNTQSATGLLYVVVILVFLGEMTSQLLSAVSLFPL